MVDLTTEKMDATSETVKQELEKKKVFVSNQTIRRRLHEAGLQYMRLLSKPLLNEQHRQRRVREMKNCDWNLVMASDETIIRLHTSRKFSWQRTGERRIARTMKFSLKVNVWGCFSEQGFGIGMHQYGRTGYQSDWVPVRLGIQSDWVPVRLGIQSDWVPVRLGTQSRLVPSSTGYPVPTG